MSDPGDVNIQVETEFGGSERLDLDEQWIAWLDDGAEIPSTVAGVDTSIDYRDDGDPSAIA